MFHNQTIITSIPVTYNYDAMIARDYNLLNMTIPGENRLEQPKQCLFKYLKQMFMHFKEYV